MTERDTILLELAAHAALEDRRIAIRIGTGGEVTLRLRGDVAGGAFEWVASTTVTRDGDDLYLQGVGRTAYGALSQLRRMLEGGEADGPLYT